LKRLVIMQLGLLMGCIGCAGSQLVVAAGPSCPVPDDVQLEIEASDRVNPDETGRSLPTRVRLYQMTDLTRLQSASFEDVWSQPQSTLAQTAVNSEELVIYPGQVLIHRFKRAPRADYIVGVAVFREAEGEAWRTAQEWPMVGDPCRTQQLAPPKPPLVKLRLRMFLDGSRIESVNGYAELPKRRCAVGSVDCAGGVAPRETGDLRRNRRLRTFEEDPREPEASAPRLSEPAD
jgi:type VI secretion system protein VasD